MDISDTKCLQIEAPSVSATTVPRDYDSFFKSKYIWGAKIIVAILAIFFLVKSIQIQSIIEVYETAKWSSLIFVLILLIPNIWIQVLKWHYLLKSANPTIPHSTAYTSLMIGYPLGFVTPGRLGEIGRALFVKEITKINALKLVLIDKISNLTVILISGLAGFLYLNFDHSLPKVRLALYLSFYSGIGLVFYYGIFNSRISQIFNRINIFNQLSRKNILAVFSFSLAFYLVFLVQYIILIHIFHPINPVTASQAGASVFMVKSLIPISFGDFGIRESASVYFFNKIGVKPAAAFNASILLYLINIGIPSLIGLIPLLRIRSQTQIDKSNGSE